MPDVSIFFDSSITPIIDAGMPEWSNGLDLGSSSLVLTKVRILVSAFLNSNKISLNSFGVQKSARDVLLYINSKVTTL